MIEHISLALELTIWISAAASAFGFIAWIATTFVRAWLRSRRMAALRIKYSALNAQRITPDFRNQSDFPALCRRQAE